MFMLYFLPFRVKNGRRENTDVFQDRFTHWHLKKKHLVTVQFIKT